MVNCMGTSQGIWRKIVSSYGVAHTTSSSLRDCDKNLIFSRVLKVFKQNGLYGNNFVENLGINVNWFITSILSQKGFIFF